jgi:hypothetical protein
MLIITAARLHSSATITGLEVLTSTSVQDVAARLRRMMVVQNCNAESATIFGAGPVASIAILLVFITLCLCFATLTIWS